MLPPRTRRAVALAAGLVALVGGAAHAAPSGQAPAPARSADTAPPRTLVELQGDRGSDGAYTGPVRVLLRAEDTGAGRVARTQYAVDGGRWQTYRQPAPEAVFDGSRASFARWKHLGGGSFALQPDGTLRTVGGLGMLYYPVRQYGSMELQTRWRALPAPAGTAAGASRGNSGVLVRFPDPVAPVDDPSKLLPCHAGVGLGTLGLVTPEWTAYNCGNEIQINDHSPSDPQRTGSVYDFAFLDDEAAQPAPVGQWVDYRIKVTGGGDYAVTVIRDGKVINEWHNTAGQLGWRSACYCGLPAEVPGDPVSDVRRFAQGFLGLQNHGASDVVEFGDVVVRDLSGEAGAFRVSRPGEHVVRYRSVDEAGNVEDVRTVRFTIGRARTQAAGTRAVADAAAPAGCTAGPATGQAGVVTCTYTASGPGRYTAPTTSRWAIHVTHRSRRGSATRLVATHATAPSAVSSGTFDAERGDTVTVRLGPDLVSRRDGNISREGTTGYVQAGDAG